MAFPFRDRNGIIVLFAAHQAMTLSDSNIDKGALAYAAIEAIENLLADFNHQLADDSDDALHEVIWDQLGHITVKPA
jgi:hypothetical protein